MIDDLRADMFRQVAADRREAIIADHVGLKQQALALGKAAVAAIDRELGHANG